MLSKQPSSSSSGSLGNNELLFRNRITISLWLHSLKGKWPFSGIRVSNGHVCCSTSISLGTLGEFSALMSKGVVSLNSLKYLLNPI